eukprot:9471873-Pyramimonas_sp.AAC.2
MVLLCCSVTWRRAAAAADCGSWSPRSAEGVTATSVACGGMGGVSASPWDSVWGRGLVLACIFFWKTSVSWRIMSWFACTWARRVSLPALGPGGEGL